MIRAIFSKPSCDYATIALSPYQSAQGPVLREYHDGRVVIDTGRGQLAGHALNRSPGMPVWMPLFGLAY
ncbi:MULTISPECIES: hypothetical protein [Paracoccus]|jgi:hypothetical protein|uniref:hypothetical protein n=1 Tax=Paracoccus TaxID=265 RepID=UPI000055587A|nr:MULTISPECIES: hypothetical protein [Paracoccus]MBB4626145.1 hypothetical protein [Paracoccus denitrificans]MCU7430593.1 hypothetical protein [Paracoccus denitrificans]MDK8872664.1 hypothetical protein [Paracoccus sp. SSJ]QAR28533.1 hypothetical protein EO213_19775 [Paracoccus denitrificans]UFS66307.1 hypothetical protein LO749_17440 [Paracoccus denitrificans]